MSMNGKNGMPSRWVDKFDEEYDVVVVGYGYGGAISALERGR